MTSNTSRVEMLALLSQSVKPAMFQMFEEQERRDRLERHLPLWLQIPSVRVLIVGIPKTPPETLEERQKEFDMLVARLRSQRNEPKIVMVPE